MASVCRSLQCLISALTQADGRGLLFRSLVPLGRDGAAFPSTLLRLPAVLYGACPALSAVPALGCSRKARKKCCACVLCLPRLSGSGSQELDGRTLPGCGSPSPLHGPSLSFSPHQSGACAFCPLRPQPQSPPAQVGCVRPVSSRDPPGKCRPSRISDSLWLETGGLFAVW